MIILVVIVVLSYNANKKIKEYVVENNELYTYFGTQKINYNTKLKLSRDNDETELIIDGENTKLDSEPLYYKNDKRIILPTNMLLVNPSNMLQKRVNYYSIISSDKNKYTLTRDGKTVDISNTFLYDGNDLYIFLENTTIKFDDKEIEIPAMSYVLCVYNDEMYIYDYSLDKVIYYEIDKLKDNNIYAESDNYLVNINYDLIKFNEKSILLNKNINKIDSII